MRPLVSVVIRTLNESKYLDELLRVIRKQDTSRYRLEIVIIDSGSTDNTLAIAEKYSCRITHIKKSDFTFGKSLNDGCLFSDGDYLVFVSGHCIPTTKSWIENLVRPLEKNCAYTYGRQQARDTTKFSEEQLFKKYFPENSKIPQEGFFCNNANAAVRRDVWEKYRFDEELTGCEDMYLAKTIIKNGGLIGYVADASVFHIHDESWKQVGTRYEREALALQKIMPEVKISFVDFLKYFFIGVAKDLKAAFIDKVLFKEFYSIICFRFNQYHGAYKGNKLNRLISQDMKLKYFYPRVTNMNITTELKEGDGS